MKIYIEKNKSNSLATGVCEYSITSINDTVSISHLPDGPPEREELLKFLVPSLENFTGWALYCSSNILFTDDVAK